VGTRLRYEKMIREMFPQIYYLRVYSPGEYKVFIYVCDKNLELPNHLELQLKEFLSVHGMAHLIHEIKHCSFIKKDKIPPANDPPPEIKILALNGELNAKGIKRTITAAFPFLNMDMIAVEGDLVKFNIPEDVSVSEVEKMVIRDYLHELIPLGTRVELP